MTISFDPDAFIRGVGERLVREFSGSKVATTPSTVGAAAEKPVRDQLAHLLPPGVAVGQGFVIDSYGGTSRQQDIVLYERDICPVFSINDEPQTTYYPCEGVIAIGEIKSRLDTASLKDAFDKVVSVKQLRRYAVSFPIPDPHTDVPMPMYRNYLSPRGDEVLRMDEGSEPKDKEARRIFGFVLAGESHLKQESLADTFARLSAQSGDACSPNLLAVLDGTVVKWGTVGPGKRNEAYKADEGIRGVRVLYDGPERWQVARSAETATHVGVSSDAEPFRLLVRAITQMAHLWRTSHVLAFDRYLHSNNPEDAGTVLCVPKPVP